MTKVVLFALSAAIVLASMQSGFSWTRGAHSGHWKKGQTIKVCVDKLAAPREKAGNDAVEEAMKEWNDAQAPFKGLKFEKVDKEPCDVKVHWKDLSGDRDWGQTTTDAPPIDVTISPQGPHDPVSDRGLIRTLKHELGHVEGLGHSGSSDVMRPETTEAQKNDPGPVKGPNDDDKAGKKTMWGTVEKEAIARVESNVVQRGRMWLYSYIVTGVTGPNLRQPITNLTVMFAKGVTAKQLTVQQLPPHWTSRFLPGGLSGGGAIPEDRSEPPPPPSLVFTVPSAEFGIRPGQAVTFHVLSPLAPAPSRVFTNSPSFDSDEFQLSVPSPQRGG